MEGVTSLAVLLSGVCSRSECGLLSSLWRCVSFCPISSGRKKQLKAESRKGDFVSTKRYCRAGRGSLCEPRKSRKTLTPILSYLLLFNSLVDRQSLRQPVDGCHKTSNAAGARALFNFMSCPPRLSQGLLFCMHVNTFFFLTLGLHMVQFVILDMRWLALSGLYHNVFGKRSCCSVHGDRCAWCT